MLAMDKTVGILGGGQLGRLLTEAANRLNIKTVTLDAAGAPAKQINAHDEHLNGSFKDPKAILHLASKCDVLTVEIEHVDTTALEQISSSTKDQQRLVEIHPDWSTIKLIQDKYEQKRHLRKHALPIARFRELPDNTIEALGSVGKEIDYPFMLKSRTGAYDGRGNCPVRDETELQTSLDALRGLPLYAEQWSHFEAELAVMVVKTKSAISEDWEQSTKAFPIVETVHENSICKLVFAPARGLATSTMDEAQLLARRAVSTFQGKGVFGVEMFLHKDGSLLINEIAPRPHNSGHYTIEACHLSQYDAHLRAILDLPIPEDSLHLIHREASAIMLNILGGPDAKSYLQVAQEALSTTGATTHLYGKGDARPGRKMGHITVLADTISLAEERIAPLVVKANEIQGMGRAATAVPKPPKISCRSTSPLVAITMGSESDLPVLGPAIALLKELQISHFVTITSAHRTPDRMVKFAKEAAQDGFKVIIAAAGGAAHLPGMLAANTILPVIGIPVKTSSLSGIDSLYSIVQMPVCFDLPISFKPKCRSLS